MKTYFADPTRSSEAELNYQKANIEREYLMNQSLNSLPIYVLILNKNRQIVYANKAFKESLSVEELQNLVGKRPGEILNCIHSYELEGGCGTTKFCSKCGAVNAILKSHSFQTGIEECRITQKNGEALDLMVWANPIEINSEFYTIFAVTDISNQKRRKILERIFFHDILNTAGSIKGFLDLLKNAEPEEVNEIIDLMSISVQNLIDEINAQKTLSLAENEELTLYHQKLFTGELLNEIINSFEGMEIAEDKSIILYDWSENIEMDTDKTVLRRIITNLIKNAFEASSCGQVVKVGAKTLGNDVIFQVYNQKVIPEDVQLQLFQRSFSTKGLGRGLGTYSVKLLCEKYMKGKVSFVSNPEEGTVFTVEIPRVLE